MFHRCGFILREVNEAEDAMFLVGCLMTRRIPAWDGTVSASRQIKHSADKRNPRPVNCQ